MRVCCAWTHPTGAIYRIHTSSTKTIHPCSGKAGSALMASPPAEVHRVIGARRVPCGGENTSKQPHAGVSIALNSAPVKPETTPGCSFEPLAWCSRCVLKRVAGRRTPVQLYLHQYLRTRLVLCFLLAEWADCPLALRQ